MDQAFGFRAASVPLWRRVRARTIALAVVSFVVAVGLVSFSWWVIESERRSMERAETADATASVVGTISGSDDPGPTSGAADDRLAIDGTARADARAVLSAARRAAAGRATFLDAGPGQLTALVPDLILVDGPSGAPGVVSIATRRGAWGAAVMGPSGTCYLLRLAAGDGVTYGAGARCTGDEALAAHDPSW